MTPTLFTAAEIDPATATDTAAVRILAIDQSSTKTGYCMVTGEPDMEPRFEIAVYDLSDIPGERTKLVLWNRWIRQVLQMGWDWVLIERPIVASGPAAGVGIVLHKIAGLIEVAVAECGNGASFAQVAGARIKKYAGHAKKQEVAFLARERWGRAIVDDNTADAAWLGDIGYHLAAGVEGSNQARREVLRDVRKQMAEEAARNSGKAVPASRARKTVKQAA